MTKKLHQLMQLLVVMCMMMTSGMLSEANAQNYALKMDNAADAVLFDNVGLAPGSSWTAEMWVKRNTQSNFSTLIDGATSKFTLETWAAGNAWTYKVGFSKKGSGDQTFNYVVPLNTWTHLAYTCNGSSVSLYANGVLKGTINQAIDLPLKGFGLLGSPNEAALATIDEVRYWKGVRTAAEISDNMYKSVDINSPNLIAYWYFDDRATKITDLSSSGLYGTNTGCTYVANDNNAFVTSLPAMTLESVTCMHKNEYMLQAGASNQEMLCIQVNTTGVTNPVSLTSMTINMNGTTATGNVSKVGITTTGSSSTFGSTTLLGAKTDPSTGNITFTGDIKLNPGKNYFWVVYDIAAGAAAGSAFDAALVSATINGTTVNPLVGDPVGNRIIASEVGAGSSAISIIPKPSSMTITEGNIRLTNDFKIKYTGSTLKAQADSLVKFLNKATGFSLTASEGSEEANSISLALITDATLGDEGYKLQATADRIKIQANTGVGLFWGIQTLRQLLPAAIESPSVVINQAWTVPLVNISDVPRFKFRGIHLDVARHFFSANFVKRYIDILAMYKINYFHWHLTDDQGWRIEIKKYPKLQTVSAWRSCGTGTYGTSDGSKYGGYYTQEQIKDVVAYASSRNITIIPEIEMPGHSVSVLAAYPEMACTSATGPFTVYCQGGITKNILCGGKEATHTFFKDVLTEVCDLFPGKYIHLGGDEAPKDNWNTCTDCMHRIDSMGITGTSQTDKSNKLQKSMMEEMAQFLAPKGKIIMGWDEVTHGGIPTGATIQVWNQGVDVASIAAAGHDLVMSNYTKIYLDSKQSSAGNEPGVSWMGINSLPVVYGYEPMPTGLTTAQQTHVIGLEAPIWTEELASEDVIEYMLAPRAQAMAERGWSTKDVTDFDNFKERLLPQYQRFDLLSWNARKLETPANSTKSVKSCEAVTLKAETTGSSYYWNDATHSTTREITVSKSGTYKCYVNFLGTIIENTYNVTIDTKTSTPEVRKNRGTSQIDLQATGDYDTYKWYTDNTATYPVSTGTTMTLPTTANDSAYYISGVQYKNNLSSLQLDGSDDVVEFANSTFMNAAKAFTFETWIKVRSWRQWDVIMSKYLANTNRVAIELGNSGELYCHMSKGASAYGLITGALSLNTWTHIAVVYDGTKTTNADRLKLYINGVLKTLTFTGTVQNTTPTISNPLRLGYATQNPSMNYADVRFWSSARTADEIKNNMSKLSAYDSNLKLYYPMDNVNDTVLFDVTSGTKASLKNTVAGYSNNDAVPGLMVAGCESQRWRVVDIEKDVTGVKSVHNTLGAEIYPNPTNGDITLDVKLDQTEDVSVKVYNLNGQIFIKDKFTSDSFKKTLSLKAFSKGVYFVSIEAGNSEKVMKVVLK